MNNEVRPIDANEFECITLKNCSDEFAKGAMYILEKIDKAPTLNYEPVRYGHWERSKDFYGFVRCSNCKSKKSEHWHIEDEWDYCNCCGCKMVKENEDGNKN